jgi:hypothetical protein
VPGIVLSAGIRSFSINCVYLKDDVARPVESLPESTRLLYTQLLSQCLQGAAPSGRGLSFVSKQIKGRKHWYLQITIGAKKTQHYVGPDANDTRALIEHEKALWKSAAPDVAAREQLVSMLLEGGAYGAEGADGRVFELLERSGVFAAGGVVVGSHAFAIYGNMLGVRWESVTTRTQDIDVAADRRVVIGVTDSNRSLRQAIIDSELGFVEVPALDRKSPSTKFRIRGRQLSVDVLTPMIGRPSAKPVYLSALATYAEPVRFLDYILTDAQPAVLLAKAGILLNVPSPARYAFHKLVVAEPRVAAFQTKRRKDLSQATQLLEVLLRDRPGDVRRAWQAVARQPSKFMQQLRSGLAHLPAGVRDEVERLTRRA